MISLDLKLTFNQNKAINLSQEKFSLRIKVVIPLKQFIEFRKDLILTYMVYLFHE